MKKIIFVMFAIIICLDTFSYTALCLPGGAVARLGKGNFNDAIFSPDGKILVIASSVGVHLYNPFTFAEIDSFETGVEMTSVALSSNGNLLASGSEDKTVKLWDVKSHKEIATLSGHSDVVTSVAFSPDSNMLATGSYDNTVKLWDMRNLTEVASLWHLSEVWSVRFSPDGSLLAGGCRNTVKLWDVKSHKEIAVLNGGGPIAFSPDGSLLATRSDDSTEVVLWDMKSHKEIDFFPHSDILKSIEFSPNGNLLAIGDAGWHSNISTVKLWDVQNHKEVAVLNDYLGEMLFLTFSPDSNLLASSSYACTVKLWDMKNHKGISVISGHSEGVNSVAFNSDGSILASGSDDKTIKLWDVKNYKDVATFSGHTDSVNSVAFSPYGNLLASGSADDTVKLWNVIDHVGLDTLWLSSDVESVVFSPNGKLLASGDWAETVKLWDVSSHREIASLSGHEEGMSIAFSPDGNFLAIESENGVIKLWDLKSYKEISIFGKNLSDVNSIAFSPNGDYLASGSNDNTIKLWNVKSCKDIATFSGHSDSVSSVAFSPDGNLLASGSRDNTVKLWNVISRKEITTLQGHSDSVNSVAFSPDGNLLASGSRDGTIILWDTNPYKRQTEVIPPQPDIAISEQQHRFEDTPVTSYDDWTFVIYNYGDIELTVNGITCDDSAFTITSQTFPRNISPKDSLIVTVRFSPTKKVTYAGNLIISSNDPDTPEIYISLEGKRKLLPPVAKFTYSPIEPKVGDTITFNAQPSTDPDGKIVLYQWDFGNRCLSGQTIKGEGESITHSYFSAGIYQVTLTVTDDDGMKADYTDVLHINCTVLEGQSALSACFSSDGRSLAIGNQAGTIEIWDMESKKRVNMLGIPGYWPSQTLPIAFSPNNSFLASATFDGMRHRSGVDLWDMKTMQAITLWEHESLVNSLTFSPNNKFLASGSDKTVKIWDVESKDCISTLDGTGVAAFSHDSRLLAFGAVNNTIKIWNVENKSLVATFDGKAPVAFSTDGKLLIFDTTGDTLQLCDIESRNCTVLLDEAGSYPYALSPDSKMLASFFPPFVQLWNIQNKERVIVANLFDFAVGGYEPIISFSPDNKFLAIVFRLGQVTLCDITSFQQMKQAPDIEISTSNINFGSVPIGNTASLPLSIANAGFIMGTATLEYKVTSSNSAFTVAGYPPFIFSGYCSDITVKFSPTEKELYTGTLTITSNDPNKPILTVSLSGNGISKDTTPPGIVSDLKITDLTGSSMTLSWTAPGDDGKEGVANRYDIRYSTEIINDMNFSKARSSPNVPIPLAAGTQQTCAISGLTSDVKYYFAMKTADEELNWSGLSNVVSERTKDIIPPSAVNDLAIAESTETAIKINWTAPGGNGKVGIAAKYDIRFSTDIIDKTNFDLATKIPNVPIPAEAGTKQTCTISNLPPSVEYYFAMKTADEVSNWSELSNVALWQSVQPPKIISIYPLEGSAIASNATFSVTFNKTMKEVMVNGSSAIIHGKIATWRSASALTPGKITLRINGSDIVGNNLPEKTVVYTVYAPDVEPPDIASDMCDPPNGATGVNPGKVSKIVIVFTEPMSEVKVDSFEPKEAKVADIIFDKDKTLTISFVDKYKLANGMQIKASISGKDLSGNPLKTNVYSFTTIEGVFSDINVSEQKHNFEDTPVASHTDWTFVISNNGNADLVLKNMISSNSAFAISSMTFPQNISPGNNLNITVSFYPTEGKPYAGFITIMSNDPDSPIISISLEGNGCITSDIIPPAIVSDLRVIASTSSPITLTWTAPGDDGKIGIANRYDIRYSTEIINDTNFSKATAVSNIPVPALAGTEQECIISGLSQGNKYYFAIKVSDEAPNTSELSNIVSVNISADPGYAIVVAGYGKEKWAIDTLAANHAANNAYRALRNLGFGDKHIFYLNHDPQEIDGRNVVYAAPNIENFRKAINEIKALIGDKEIGSVKEYNIVPLILYFVGHGVMDGFSFDESGDNEGTLLTVVQLKTLLEGFSLNRMLIMVGACYSGSFITKEFGDLDTISDNNRIIITATRNVEGLLPIYPFSSSRPVLGWARSSDSFWGDLMKGFSVKDVFIRRNLPGDIWNLWLDDNGDGVGHPPNSLEDDGNLASITKIGKPNSDNLKLVPWILYLIGSPGEIRVYDSQNRVTGIVNGEVKEGIPASVSSIKDEAIILFDPSDSYHYEVVGTGEGAYTLEIASVRDKESTDFAALDIPIRVGVIHQYTIDWEALSKEEKGVTVEMDSNGDGIFEKTITVSTTLSGKDLEIACVKGDVNGDGKIQANDAILALRISAGLMTPTPQQSCAADMNEDGEVMANDAILILRKVAGLAAPDKQTVLNSGKSVKAILEEAHGVSGESIVVPVKVDNTDLLAGGDICITYDSTVLRAVDVISDDDILLVDNINEVAKVRIAFASSDKLNHNVLARVRFDILRDDTSPLKFESVEFYQRDADLMNVSKIDTKFSSWAIRPDHSALLQNFPNPFNPETWIPYQLKEGSEVSIRIFNVSGNLVRELRLGYKPAGLYISRDRSAYWNGRNEAGEFVSSGLYFYSIEAGEFIVTHKMIMLK